jgi:hypothetical protein
MACILGLPDYKTVAEWHDEVSELLETLDSLTLIPYGIHNINGT